MGERLTRWFKWVYEGNARDRKLGLQMLRDDPGTFAQVDWIACATGDEAGVAAAIARDPGWVNQPCGPMGMPPLVAVTHSTLILEEGFEAGLLASAALLLQAGANVNCTWIHSDYPQWPLSALYGAAGKNHHAGMTKLLLDGGANPDDNESVYHSVESPDPACTRLLLEAGATLAGTNSIAHVLDEDKLDHLRLLLAHGGDGKEQSWLHWAILRGRSIEHIQALVDAGADLRAVNEDGTSVFRWAHFFGRTDVVALLRRAGVDEAVSEDDQFVAACARGDEAAARTILERVPDMVVRLSPRQLEALPEAAATGRLDAVKTMLALGWPREVKTEWGATALNHAVYRGDVPMAKILLASGADWRTQHNFNDNAIGTLAWSSRHYGENPAAAQVFVDCARALVEAGIPLSEFAGQTYSEAVHKFLDSQ